ncbi:hypothetical protein RSOLAG1IB_05151 [Rhizoctonia solani AG-1 IB]|uniref:Uncharacterized protein n=1 Tax=Thanatephorus cucumeris (strain AG1-IB / isolate 7/3/14) TaxID=1108050 RepID=A0A0B7FYW9_THACB|nr:hypothetical protein RSOLAG1IB_05151 [Rhizoctonia solani AG-1 IB]
MVVDPDLDFRIAVAIANPDGELYSPSMPSSHARFSWECYIASSDNERFEVHWWPTQPDTIPDKYKRLDLRATVYLDGVKVEDGILPARHWRKGYNGSIEGQQVDKDNVRHFQWGSRKLLEEDTDPDASPSPIDLNLHTIRVVVEWGSPPPAAGSRKRQTFVAPPMWNPIQVRLGDTRHNDTIAALLEDPAPFAVGPPENHCSGACTSRIQ